MTDRKVSSMGFELNYSVPATVEEYNNLAPKRENPVLEDAIANVIFRGVLNGFRDQFLELLGKVTQIARINHGTEDEPQLEKDAVYFKRIKATVAKARGLDPAAQSTSDKLMAEWSPIAQTVLTGGTVSYTNEKGESVTETCKGITFDPSVRESTGGSAPVGKADLALAQEAIDKGKAEALAGMLGKILDRVVEQDQKSLAIAIKDRRKKIADEQAAKDRAELGM